MAAIGTTRKDFTAKELRGASAKARVAFGQAAIPKAIRTPKTLLKNFRAAIASVLPEHARGKPLEIWFQML